MDLNTNLIYEAVYDLCVRANTILPQNICKSVKDGLILQNAYLARQNNRPLCQDTGVVMVFMEIGQEVRLQGAPVKNVINKAVKDSYINEFYRKSVVKDALFDRTNTRDNTPAIIYTDIAPGSVVKITVGIKGAGAENMSNIKMFNPTASEDEIVDFIINTSLEAGENACPPYDIGIGIGGTMDYACVLAKKALFFEHPQTDFERLIMSKIPDSMRVSVLTYASHIASLPVCVNINCHSSRHACAQIVDNKIICVDKNYEINEMCDCASAEECFHKVCNESDSMENVVRTLNEKTLSDAVEGEKIKYTGFVYTARDVAHKKIVEIIERGEKPPFELKGAVIFYAGPAPAKNGEIIGPVGPTTSKRMDTYAPILYKHGVLAVIGKGKRKTKGLYFIIKGGISNVIQQCVKSCEIVAFPQLDTEAVRKLYVENLPLTRKS